MRLIKNEETVMNQNVSQRINSAGMVVVLLLCAALLPIQSYAARVSYTQTFDLHPGWNAVYLEVQPEQNDIDQMLAGIPVESVWRWIPTKVDQVQFILDPAEGLQNINGWHGYFPYPRPEAFLTNLFSMRANQAYLIKLGGTQNVTWQVTGRPQATRTRWISDSFNLVGMGVDPGNEPTFGDYFSSSPAHAGQSIYRLAANGVWEPIQQPYATPIKSGEAYWVYVNGKSAYQGPMEVTLTYGKELEYKASLTSQKVIVQNNTSIPTAVTVRRIGVTTTPMPLSYELIDSAGNERSWPSLQNSLSYSIEAENDVIFNLGVVRKDFTEERMEELLEFTNGLGSRVLVFVGGNTIQPPVLPANYQPSSQLSASSSGKGAAALTAVHPFAGLWVGVVSVRGVSNAQFGDVTPQPTGRAFPARFLFHVDTSGQARLLKDVVEMWQDGTFKPSASDPTKLETDIPGRYVLITDPNLIPNYTGAKTRDGTPVGIRHSTIAYDFDGQFQNFEPASFNPPFSMSTTIRLSSDFPTNPFKHKFHPDHDNLDAQFLNPVEEAYEVTRSIEFEFTAEDPSGNTPPDWGDSILGGYYRETISGLHRNAIFVDGVFRFRRISAVPVLNQ
jgi:hypothetical protein